MSSNAIESYLNDPNEWNPVYEARPLPLQFLPELDLNTSGRQVHTTAAHSSRRTSSSHASTRSTVVSRSNSDCSAISATTSNSSVSQTPDIPWHQQALNVARPISYNGNYLPCEFVLLECEHTFHPEEVEAWISHHESHFGTSPVPPKSICTICDDSTARFPNSSDAYTNWKNRMTHIAEHLARGERGLRPDFWVLDYMHEIGKLPQKVYEHAISYTERPDYSGIVPLGFKPPEQKQRERKKERESRQVNDQAREDRLRRRVGGGRSSAEKNTRGRS